MNSLFDEESSVARSLPYGVANLDPEVCLEKGPPRRVRCYVAGCDQVVRVPTKVDQGEICPVHGIRCHYSMNSPKYSYADARRNIIVSQELFASRIVGHPFKYESHRLGLENSEDALTWNVFRSLQEAGCLHDVAHWITGLGIDTEPTLFLWGICLANDRFEPWDLLIAARERFENNLPVERPLTEPDIALYLPGQYLILIEAKFTSPNPWYVNGPRKDSGSLTKDELLELYNDSQFRMLDGDKAQEAERVHYQLWRNMVFAEWMALTDGMQTRAYHANLTRAGREVGSCAEFHKLVRPDFSDRFVQIAWEDIYHLVVADDTSLGTLRGYLENKTAGLRQAFRVDRRLGS